MNPLDDLLRNRWVRSERGGTGRQQEGEARAQRARFARGLALLRKRGLIDRPRYLVIGAARSGKSAWLQGAGFERLIAAPQSLATVEPKAWPPCDWWSDGSVVMLEAGVQNECTEGWHVLLGLLRRRFRGYLAGIIVVAGMPAPHSEHAHDRAGYLRAKVDDALTALGTLPVYLVLTHVDRVAGFTDCFGSSTADERCQVWGATFTGMDGDVGSPSARVSAHFEALSARLDAQLTQRLRSMRDALGRLRLFAFTQELRCHGDAVASFVEHVFGVRAAGGTPMLRGVYLVSNAQEDGGCDSVASSVSRHFGIRGRRRPPVRTARRTYFGQRLVRDVLLPEAGMARRRWTAWRRWACACAMLVLVAGTVWAMLERHGHQTRLLSRVNGALHGWPGEPAAPASLRTYYEQTLRRLDPLVRAEILAGSVGENAPFVVRMQGAGDSDTRDMLRDARLRGVAEGILPGLDMQMREAMRTEDPREIYLALKGHLMLAEPARRDDDALRRLARTHWRRVFDDEGFVAALDRHMGDLFGRRGVAAAVPADGPLVETARTTLRAADMATLVYAELVSGVTVSDDDALRPDRALGLFSNSFRRRSGEPLSAPLSPLHTRAAFLRMLGGPAEEGAIAAAVGRFVEDAWVLGGGHGSIDRQMLESRVRELYVADYIATWDAWLADLEWQHGPAAVNAIRAAGPASPFKALLLLLREHTRGLGEGENGPQGRIAAAARIAAHFAALTDLLEGDSGRAPLDGVLAAVDAAGRQFLATSADATAPLRSAAALQALRIEAARLPPPLSSWLDDLAGSGQVLLSRRTDAAIRTALREAVGSECAKIVGELYPFAPAGRRDIPLHTFTALFSRGGRLDAFFKEHLAGIVDTSRSVWRYREGVSAGSTEVLSTARAAAAIRDTWFNGGDQPMVEFTLSVETLPPGVGRVTIEIDGQTYERIADKQAAGLRVRWPGPAPARAAISAWDSEGRALSVLDYPGEWGWFHALDAARLERRTDTRFEATFMPGGHAVRVAIEAAGLQHPFADTAARRFRCPS